MRLSELFYFSKSDRKALLFLLCVAAVAILMLTFLGTGEERTVVTAADSVAVEDAPNYRPYAGRPSAYREKDYRQRGYGGADAVAPSSALFPFDPNTADSTQLLRLGLSPWQVRNIYKYRAKGGIYRHPEDFAQLYGLTLEQYRRLEPYIRISADYQPAADYVKRPPTEAREAVVRDTLLYPVKLKQGEHIVLNTADTTQLKKVPGIGSGWARQILFYGSRLGGYVSVNQLLEIDGFPPEVLDYFVVSQPQPRKLLVNQLTLNELRRHPYINFYQARAITDYRRLKGSLQSLEQLRLLKEFPPEAIERLRPYVEF